MIARARPLRDPLRPRGNRRVHAMGVRRQARIFPARKILVRTRVHRDHRTRNKNFFLQPRASRLCRFRNQQRAKILFARLLSPTTILINIARLVASSVARAAMSHRRAIPMRNRRASATPVMALVTWRAIAHRSQLSRNLSRARPPRTPSPQQAKEPNKFSQLPCFEKCVSLMHSSTRARHFRCLAALSTAVCRARPQFSRLRGPSLTLSALEAPAPKSEDTSMLLSS